MKSIKYLYNAIKNPRLFVQALEMRFRDIIKFVLLTITIMSVCWAIRSRSLYKEIKTDVTACIDYIPEFTFQGGNLEIEEGSDPLYYSGNFFQLVIDEDIKPDVASNQFIIPNDKAKLIKNNLPFNIYVIKTRIYAIVNSSLYNVSDILQTTITKSTLVNILNNLTTFSSKQILPIIIGVLMVNIPEYLYILILVTIFSGIFNGVLSVRLPFLIRMKLATAASFWPIVVVYLLNTVFPGVRIGTSIIVIASLIIIYQAFKQHTDFYKSVLDNYSSHIERMFQNNPPKDVTPDDKSDETSNDDNK